MEASEDSINKLLFPWSFRRKKKCIRVQASLQSSSSTSNSSLHHHHHQQRNQLLHPSKDSSTASRSEEDDGCLLEEEDQDTKTSMSEATLSPAGFSSIGSPTGSLASPLTPQELRSTWYYPTTAAAVVGLGAFKPPITTTSTTATSMNSKRSHDPRDAKHPLSICQLTGNASLSSASSTNSSLAAAICAASAMATSANLFGLRWRRFGIYAVTADYSDNEGEE